ncbi:LysR family transcriptional regulator [Cardiobacteriaceae bacterium TAE3-ERU3]|nr:LysR family transcriptional regulator [Cardiobacteriaceae bacterium TAE3-ERU3]
MLERHHLAIIRAVVEHGTLTKAAESLFLTQSALSHTIKKIEEQLGIALWHKEGRRLRLTQAGWRLHDVACRLLPQFEFAEDELRGFAEGRRGSLRIGMECHPCYRWLLTVVNPFLHDWPEVDVDVKQQFQFQGIAALINHEVDILITPDPVQKEGLIFSPVFAFEQKLVVSKDHPLAAKKMIEPDDLTDETLFSYPVPTERLDIFNQFLRPANASVAKHKTIETSEIMLELVAAGRGVAALPGWLVEQQAAHIEVTCLQLGKNGIHKHIHVGIREQDSEIDYLCGFIELAGKSQR